MGCDGGTIPKRKEIVKNRDSQSGSSSSSRNANLSAKWQFCHLSGLKLKQPIVSCQLGFLYNKDAVIEHLLNLKQPSASSKSTTSQTRLASHIKSLRDIRDLKLKEKPEFDGSHQALSGSEQFKAQFVCPISGLDLNGKYKFYFLLTCGCVFSERALRRVPNGKECIICCKPYNPDMDLIILNGDEAELKELGEKMDSRKKLDKSKRRAAIDDASMKSKKKVKTIK